MNKTRVQALDTLQYFYSFKHEPLIRCIITFLGHIDGDALKKAVELSSKALPVIKCRFAIENGKPRWIHENFSPEDIVKTIEAGPDVDSQAQQLALSVIDISSGPQLKIFILRGEASDKLIIIMNHMVCDGSGFKEYLYLLARLYTGFTCNEAYSEDLIERDRGLAPLLKSLTLKQRIKILRSKPDLDKQKNDIVLDFQGDNTNPFIEKRTIGKDVLNQAKGFAKKNGVTLNDILMAEYARILSRETGKTRVILPCPVDLRKFINKPETFGISNLTSNYICDINISPSETFLQTVQKVSAEMKRQKSDTSCIKPVLLFGLGFKLLSFKRLQSVFNNSFTIPVVSYTNLGVLDKQLLSFGDMETTDAFITAAVKYVPYFQITISSFDDVCTLSSSMYGTAEDREKIKRLLERFVNDIAENTNCLERQ